MSLNIEFTLKWADTNRDLTLSLSLDWRKMGGRKLRLSFFVQMPMSENTNASLTIMQISSNADAVLFVLLYLSIPSLLSPVIHQTPVTFQTRKGIHILKLDGLFFILTNRFLMTSSRDCLERKKKQVHIQAFKKAIVHSDILLASLLVGLRFG